MPEVKMAFIDPEALLGALTVQPIAPAHPGLDLGPSGPHEFGEPEEAAEPLAIPGLSLSGSGTGTGTGGKPGLTLHPGAPPPIVSAAHYTDVLDELWPEFDDPEERTAARLRSLLDEVADEAQRVHLLAQDVWDKLPAYKVPDSERERYDKEFLAYLRRLNDYQDVLDDLEPESTATDAVYVGLVRRRQGAGPVPDAIMHMYFAQQLGILSDHAEEMSEGFMGRVMDGLSTTNRLIDQAAEEAEEAEKQLEKDIQDWWKRFTRPWKIAGGVLLGSIVVLTGAVVVDAILDEEPGE